MNPGGDVIDIFGDWGVWGEGWGYSLPPKAPEGVGRQPDRREEWEAEDLVVGEIANLTALMTYAESGGNGRQARLLDFIKYHEVRGIIGGMEGLPYNKFIRRN